MHELALAGAVIDTAERHAGGRRIMLVRLRLGELRQVVPDSLTFYFEHVARGTLCEGAALEHEVVPAMLGCTRCDAIWELSATPGPDPATWDRPPLSFRCPQCGSGDVGIRSGNEFEVESIEVEEPACTG
jgi:hydrogenase nickel incorporation protein HypA/HybF